jgi:redox-sensitive bicupin YhaK (pirin superfamily)
MKILHRDSLPRGGFAGLKETRLVIDNKIGGDQNTWNGLGNFVYLADARFLPHGETHMHSHREIDVITVMLEGQITHEGSLENGQSMIANQVQVQRAGGEGFSHNEINPDQSENRLLQIWALPETTGEAAGYKFYDLKKNQLTKIYGGNKLQASTFDSHTIIEVGIFEENKTIKKDGKFLAYITNGEAIVNGIQVTDGDLIDGKDLTLLVLSDHIHLTLISHS